MNECQLPANTTKHYFCVKFRISITNGLGSIVLAVDTYVLIVTKHQDIHKYYIIHDKNYNIQLVLNRKTKILHLRY